MKTVKIVYAGAGYPLRGVLTAPGEPNWLCHARLSEFCGVASTGWSCSPHVQPALHPTGTLTTDGAAASALSLLRMPCCGLLYTAACACARGNADFLEDLYGVSRASLVM
jgi:hypothetical protein